MATLAESLRPMLSSVRAIPAAMGLHTTRVTVRTRTWSGGEIGTGAASDSDFPLGNEVKARLLTTQELLSSGGFFEFDDVKVEFITPAHATGGYTLQQSAPSTQGAIPPGVEYIYLLTGAMSGEFRLKNLDEDSALHYTLFLRQDKTNATAHAR